MRRDVLLLQGPIGPFFARFADELTLRGFNVHKVNLNGGDRFFYRKRTALDYTGTPADWEAWLERLIINRQVGRVYLFGDCRSYHRVARQVCARHDVRVFVFEEGYIRPNFVTLEESGVNGYSEMIGEPLPDAREGDEESGASEVSGLKRIFGITIVYAMLYYWACAASHSRFTHYRHHRPLSWRAEGWCWVVSGLRKWRYGRRERDTLPTLLGQFDQNYFLCPLQVHCDMQVVVHSPYNSIEHYISDVLVSFAQHAPSNKAIVFKHHPLDRGYTNYTVLVRNLASKLDLTGRVFYVHDLCLPTLLKHAGGTVVINSTVGLSSLFHGTPVKTMGVALYDRPELTSQEPLDNFWSKPGRIDAHAFQRFRFALIRRNQLNGSLYRQIPGQGPAGLGWSERLRAEHTFDATSVADTDKPQLKIVAGTDVAHSRRGRGGKLSKAA